MSQEKQRVFSWQMKQKPLTSFLHLGKPYLQRGRSPQFPTGLELETAQQTDC